MSNSLWLHRLQQARLPCPSPTLGAYSNSCPSSQLCHPYISSSVITFSSCLQYFPASGSFPMSKFLHQVAKVLDFQYSRQIFLRIDWFDVFEVQGNLKSLLQHHSSKPSTLWCSVFFIVHPLHPNMTTGKSIALARWILLQSNVSAF